jgi:type IV pilus assembly protein PilC
MKLQRRAVMFRSLAVMFDAGIPLVRAFDHLSEHLENPEDREVARELAKQLSRGCSLSHAANARRDFFTRLQVKMLEVGMTTGALGRVLREIADHEERSVRTSMQLRAALTYPLILMLVCLAFVVFLPPYALAGIFDLILSFDVPLPWPTKVVLGLSNLVTSGVLPLILIVGGSAFYFLAKRLLDNSDFRYFALEHIHSFPVLGPLVKTVAVTRFAQSLAVQIHVGMPIHQALKLAASASDNPVLEARIGEAVRILMAGSLVHEALDQTGFFTPLFVQSVCVGEEVGSLDRILEKLAMMMELELEHHLEVLSGALEPLVMLMMGLIAGFMIVATMMPLADVVRTL